MCEYVYVYVEEVVAREGMGLYIISIAAVHLANHPLIGFFFTRFRFLLCCRAEQSRARVVCLVNGRA
jgi:hypothetical protein